MTKTRREFLKTAALAGCSLASAEVAYGAPPERVPGRQAKPRAQARPASEPFTRGVGVYPGDPADFFGPELVTDTSGTYRNLALLRPAFHSSAYD